MFIVFEGIDGSGKSTQMRFLAEFLRSQGRQVVTTFEPTDNRIGTGIRTILKEHRQIAMKDLQKLYCEDRKKHLKDVIEPYLKAEKIVICDRYHWSTIAFGMLGMDKQTLKEMGKSFRVPDLTILLDVNPTEAISRIEKRGQTKELFEKLEKMKKVRENYLSLRGEKNFFVVDGNRRPEEIFGDVKRLVLKIL